VLIKLDELKTVQQTNMQPNAAHKFETSATASSPTIIVIDRLRATIRDSTPGSRFSTPRFGFL